MTEMTSMTKTELDWTEIDRVLQGFARRRATLDAEELPWLLAAKQARLHERLGYATILEYIERVLGYGPKVALERLRVAEAAAALPPMAAALSEGKLCYSAVRELTRVATPGTASAWVAAAEGRTMKEIQELVSGRRPGTLPSDLPSPEARLRKVTFELTPATHAQLTKALRNLEAQAGGHLTEDQAIAAMTSTVLSALAGGPATSVHAIAPADGERRAPSAAHGRSELERDADVVELGAAALDGPGHGELDGLEPLGRSIRQRFHGRCAVPGCRATRQLLIHDLHDRPKRRRQDAASLVLLCRAHVHRVRERLLVITGRSPDALAFHHADGRRYGAPPPHVVTARLDERATITPRAVAAS